MNSKIFNEVNKMINTIIFEIQCSLLNIKNEILATQSDLKYYIEKEDYKQMAIVSKRLLKYQKVLKKELKKLGK